MGQEGQQEKKTEDYVPDKELINGPLANRSCRDIFWCLLFILNIAAFIAIGGYGFNKGHPDRLLVAYDSNGNACGKDSLSDYKYVFMPAGTNIKRSVCVKNCYTDEYLWDDKTQAQQVWNKMEVYSPTNEAYTANPQVYCLQEYSLTVDNKDLTKVGVYQTKPYFGRVCLPYGKSVQDVVKNVSDVIASGTTTLEQYISDIKTAWGIILGSVGIAFVIAFIYMVILRFCAGILTWLTIIAYFAAIIALAVLILKKGQEKYDDGVETQSDKLKSDGNNLKYCSYAVFAFAGLCFVIFLCLFSKIRLAIAIIKSAALFVAEVKSVFIVPPVITIINMLFIAWWIVTFVFVYSVGDIQGSENGPFASIKWEKNTRYMLCYHIFSGLWINAFFNALLQFIIASACAIWYFSKPQEPHLPVSTGLKRGMTYHFGSLAFGSLILALVQFVRLVLEYIHQQMEKSGASQNKLLKFFMNCLRCYAACFERFIKFLNKNAYIQIAITGESFCGAAFNAFKLIFSEAAKFGIIATLGEMFIFVGRLFICCITGLISYIVLIKAEYYKENVVSPIIPTIFCGIIGYFIGSFFMGVYSMGVDTILHCSCLDEKIMKQTGQEPQKCPEPLKEFFQGMAKK